jgi:hypothetical protein
MPTLTLKLNEKDITEILKPALEQQYGLKVVKLTVNVENHYEDRPCGGSYPKFSNVQVEFGEKLYSGTR